MQFDHALEVIAGVMRDGAASHPDNDWVERSATWHANRAAVHLSLLRNGGPAKEDNLAHACCRILMALQLREAAKMATAGTRGQARA
jgi:hypothetical protein